MPSNAVAALLLSGRNRQRRFPGTTQPKMSRLVSFGGALSILS
jgi:hypothetical protein